jgi:ribosomal protein L16 Arg81 hydroxylase
MSGLDLDFETLIAPIEPDAFFRDTWEKRTLLVARNKPDFYSGLFSMRDVASMIYSTRPSFSGLRSGQTLQHCGGRALRGVFPHQEQSFSGGENDLSALSSEYAQSKTIFVHGLEQRWQPLAEFCRRLEGTLGHPVNTAMFLTPKGSQGVEAHFDSVDTFILQIEGSKHWLLYEPRVELPLKELYEVIPEDELPEPIEELHLKPGDLMYLPRGYIHRTFTSDCSSLHVTVAVAVLRWADLLGAALARLSSRDVRFRQAVPVGSLGRGEVTTAVKSQFDQLAQELGRSLRAEEAFDALSDKFINDMLVLPEGQFIPPEDIERIDLATILAKINGAICRVVQEKDSVSIQFPGNRTRGPRQIAPALEFIAAAERFPVRALPGNLSDNAKLVLCRRLVRDGLLRIAEEQPTPVPRPAPSLRQAS